MGQLVFQAALGGQTNLVGPNTASTINLNVPAVNGTIVTTGDTASVTSAMISGPVTVAKGGTGLTSTPSNGQLDIGNGTDFTRATLTAGAGITITNGSGSISIASTGSSSPIGTDLSYVDYSLTTSSAINGGASTIYFQSISLDGTSELFMIYGSSSAHAVVWNSSTNTFGTPILVRTANLGGTVQTVALAKISSTAVLICSLAANTALETVVLTVSGSTITVGTALATTLGANSSLIAPNTRLVTVGSSYVLNYYTTADSLPKFRAITVTGTTPTIGAELAYAGGTVAAMHHSYAQSATILLHFSMTASTTVFVLPITVSGTTLTAGTEATVSTTSATVMVTGALSSSRYALCYLITTIRGAVVSVAGTVASISTAATTMAVTTFSPMMQVFGNQAFIVGGTAATEKINIITDTAGVATLGTDLTVATAGVLVGYLSTSKVFFASATAGTSTYYQYGISSGSAVLEKTFQNVTNATVVVVAVAGLSPYTRPLSGLPQSGSGTSLISLRTSAGKMVIGNNSVLNPFCASIDGTYPAKLQQSANPFNAYNDAISDAVCWGLPSSQSSTSTTVQLRKVTLV